VVISDVAPRSQERAKGGKGEDTEWKKRKITILTKKGGGARNKETHSRKRGGAIRSYSTIGEGGILVHGNEKKGTAICSPSWKGKESRTWIARYASASRKLRGDLKKKKGADSEEPERGATSYEMCKRKRRVSVPSDCLRVHHRGVKGEFARSSLIRRKRGERSATRCMS